MGLEKLFSEHLKKQGWANRPRPILLAVSGGIDSMVMANLFLNIKMPFAIAHCNFQLRGADADQDEQLVHDWCIKQNVPFFVNHFDTGNIAKEWKKGIQETARKLRYDWFLQLCKQENFTYIATAHHANDTVETLLINLFKGTGIKGLQGIPAQNGNIIRPLLFATRKAIAAYAESHQVPYREDASNASDKYLRNIVRHQLIPKIEEHFPDAGAKLYDSIHRFTEAALLYDEAVERKIKKLKEQRGKDLYIPVRKLEKATPLSTLCYELFKPYDFSKEQLPQLIDLMKAESGKYLLSPTYQLIKDRNFLILTERTTQNTDLLLVESVPCTIPAGTLHFQFSLIHKPQVCSTSADIALIDFSQISFPMVLRKWRQGDYFYPLGMNRKKKKLSRFFIDQKIPLHEKENIWVLECNKKIVWIAGWRLDERFKLTDTTTEVLKIEMRLH